MGDRIRFLIGKPYRAEGNTASQSHAIFTYRRFREQLNNPDLTLSEIAHEIEKQLGIKRENENAG